MRLGVNGTERNRELDKIRLCSVIRPDAAGQSCLNIDETRHRNVAIRNSILHG